MRKKPKFRSRIPSIPFIPVKILSSNPRSKNTTQTSSLNEQESDSTPASSSLILELWDIHRNQTDFHLRSVFSVCSVVDQIR